MAVHSTYNGNPVHWDEHKNDWEFDGRESCPKCGGMPTPEGYDACIGYVPGATAVCCGHGIEEPYVVFEGQWALDAIEWAKKRGSDES